MYIEELFIIVVIVIAIYLYRNYKGENVGKYVAGQLQGMYEKFAPYSFQVVHEKTKQLGQEYTVKQYTLQVAIFAGFAGTVSYLYFYNVVVSVIYVIVTVSFIPYLAYLRCKRVYSEFIFEQVQVYVTNTIMEFAVAQSFVKALEGVLIMTDVREYNIYSPEYVQMEEENKELKSELTDMRADIDFLKKKYEEGIT